MDDWGVIELTVREVPGQPGYWSVTGSPDEHVHGRIFQNAGGTFAWEVHRPVPAGEWRQSFLTGHAHTHEEAVEKITSNWPGGSGNAWPTEYNDA